MQIKVSPIYKDIFPIRSLQNVSIERAPLHCKSAGALLAQAFSDAVNSTDFGSNIVVLSLTVNRLRTQASKWLGIIDQSAKKRSDGWTFDHNDTTLWIVDPRKLKLDDLPFLTVDRLFVTDAHGVSPESVNRLKRLTRRGLTAEGEFQTRNSWFYTFGRDDSTTLHQLTANNIADHFPDQRSILSRLNDEYDETEKRRFLNLEDVDINIGSFSRFARQRLFVRTDRPTHQLTPLQREYAAKADGTPIVPFMLSPLQKRYEAMKRLSSMKGKKPWYLLLKFRRGGYTTLEQAKSYQKAVTQSHNQVVTLAHTKDATGRIFKIAKYYHENDPRNPELTNDSKSSLSFSNGSSFFIGTAGGKGFSRGDTLSRVHGSEVSKWCDGNYERVDDLVAGLLGAASNGEVIFETTPNGMEWFAQKYIEAKNNQNEFTPLFLPWFVDKFNILPDADVIEIHDTLTDNEEEFIAMVKRSYGLTINMLQIAFRREKQKQFKRLFAQEFPEDDISCFLTSGTPFFDLDTLSQCIEHLGAEEHGRVQHVPGGSVTFWEEPQEGVMYVAGCDTSEGLPNGDLNGVGVMRKDNGKQVASLHGRFRPDKLAELGLNLCIKYNNALFGVERNNHGHSVVQWVMEHGPSIYKNHQDRGGRFYHRGIPKGAMTTQDKKGTSSPGWDTNVVTRPLMLDDLYEWIKAEGILGRVNDRMFVQESMTFKKQKNGKYAADPGSHDDSVMKWAVCVQMLKCKIVKASIST